MDFLLIWVLGGRGFAETEGERVEARQGHLLTFMPGRAHTYGSDRENPWDILWVHFHGRLAREFFTQIRRHGGVRVEMGIDANVYDRWAELVVAQAAGGPGSGIRGDTALCSLLGLILNRLECKALPAPETGGNRLDAQRLLNYIHHHLAEPLDSATLARQAGLSTSHFSRLFKRQFSASPVSYVIQKRIALACSLLTETTMTLHETSLRVGYDDAYYFSRLFKKVTGVCPSLYRTRQKNQGRRIDRKAGVISRRRISALPPGRSRSSG